MQNILVLGAGRCSPVLVSYLCEKAETFNWSVTVGDMSPHAATAVAGSHPRCQGIGFDIHDEKTAYHCIQQSAVVISLLPPALHVSVARYCLEARRHLITASYVSDEMKALNKEAKEKQLYFINECGLDPGLDHMSAMRVIDAVRSSGGMMTSVESFAGGLIAPETDAENPWRYKFTWNSMNVVTAGQKTARYLYGGQVKYIPYQQLFTRLTPVSVEGYGDYEGYMNRDSLQYKEVYGLDQINTLVRGTLRNKGFCAAWNILVQLGCCDHTFQMENVSGVTHRKFLSVFLPARTDREVEHVLMHRFGLREDSPEMNCLRWSGFFTDEVVGINSGTPAQVLEHILNKKWKLADHDKDMIVMWHRFRYILDGKEKETQSSLAVKGEDARHTAMAKTVGLPLAMAARLVLTNQFKERGVIIPVNRELYEPILHELEHYNVTFHEREIS